MSPCVPGKKQNNMPIKAINGCNTNINIWVFLSLISEFGCSLGALMGYSLADLPTDFR